MLFKASLHPRLVDGSITVAFRCWKRPSVATGTSLRTPAGVLHIDEVRTIGLDEITEDDARAAGAPTLAALRATLHCDGTRQLYRIRFHRSGDDPRVALRQSDDLSGGAGEELTTVLGQWDRRSRSGPWTQSLLRAIAAAPGRSSWVLAEELGMARPALKRRIRRLKELGLTKSLETGYRLSRRGERYLADHSPE